MTHFLPSLTHQRLSEARIIYQNMSTTIVLKTESPMKGDIVLTRKGHRRLWDGRHWRVLCQIPYCTAQRQGSLDNKIWFM